MIAYYNWLCLFSVVVVRVHTEVLDPGMMHRIIKEIPEESVKTLQVRSSHSMCNNLLLYIYNHNTCHRQALLLNSSVLVLTSDVSRKG